MGGSRKNGKARQESLQMYVVEMVEAFGGPDKAAEFMADRNKSPIDFAIQFCGGQQECAQRMGVSRQTLAEWLKRPVRQWRVEWLEKLSQASGIEEKTLKRSAPPAPDELNQVGDTRKTSKRGRKMT